MDIDRELRYGPGMRVQRLAEAAFLVAALFTQDLRFAGVAFVLTALQALNPRWVPVALLVAWVARFRGQHRIGDMYFDLRGVRGACAISVLAQAAGFALALAGHRTAGLLVLTVPAASLLMAPTLGFCAGCWFYVLGRDWLVRHGWLQGGSDGLHDITVDGDGEGEGGGGGSAHQRQLRPSAQR